jgi:hypothetical protein
MEDPVQIVSAPDRTRRWQTLWLAVVTVAAVSSAAGAWWAFRRHLEAGTGWGGLGMELGLFVGSVVIAVLLLAARSITSGKVGLRGKFVVAALLVGVWMLHYASSKY